MICPTPGRRDSGWSRAAGQPAGNGWGARPLEKALREQELCLALRQGTDRGTGGGYEGTAWRRRLPCVCGWPGTMNWGSSSGRWAGRKRRRSICASWPSMETVWRYAAGRRSCWSWDAEADRSSNPYRRQMSRGRALPRRCTLWAILLPNCRDFWHVWDTIQRDGPGTARERDGRHGTEEIVCQWGPVCYRISLKRKLAAAEGCGTGGAHRLCPDQTGGIASRWW